MMEHYLTAITDYISHNPQVGLICALLIAFAESLPILGTIIPGSITMTAIGILAGKQALPLGDTLLLAISGALMGDILGYWVGRYYQDRIHKIWPFKRYPKMLAMGRDFFHRHGGKSIIIGRFIGPTRSSVPLIAGLLKMRGIKFLLAAIPSAALWACLYLFPGVLLGAVSLALPKGKATTFTLIGLGIIVLLWLIFWAIQRGFVYLVNLINRMTDRCWDWLSTHHGTRLITRMLTSKRDPQDHHQLTLLIFMLILFGLFIFIAVSVIFHWGIYHANQPVFHFLQNLRGPKVNKVFAFMTELGDQQVIIVISLLALLYLVIRRQWYAAWHVAIIVLLTFSAVWFFKHVYFSPRPQGFMVVKSNSSFPSGHTTLSTGVIGFFTFLYAQCLDKRWRWIPYTLWAMLFVMVGLSRLILAAHWFCDVIAGMCFGASMLLLTIIAYRRWMPPIKQPPWLMISLLLAVLLPWGYAGSTEMQRNIYRATPYFPDRIIRFNRWWQHSNGYSPLYRLNRFGHPVQPFNMQWAGNLNDIKKQLEAQHWQEVSFKDDLKRALARFVSKNPEQHIAFLPQLYHNQPPVLFMIKHLDDKARIIELRLWRTNIGFKEAVAPLLIGSVNYHMPSKSFFDLEPSDQITLAQGGGVNELIASLNKKDRWKKVSVGEKQLPQKIKLLDWDKTILLVYSSDK